MSPHRQLPPFLQFMDALGYRVRLGRQAVLGYTIYRVDLSSWRLRFGDLTPFIHVTAEQVQELSPPDLAQSLMDTVRSERLGEQLPVVLLECSDPGLSPFFRRSLYPILLVDARAQRRIQASKRPTGDLLDLLVRQVPPTLLAPYEDHRPVTGSRFFGRTQELRRILQGGNTNVAIMGVRRIGKTSLLLELRRRWLRTFDGDSRAVERFLYMDCSPLTDANDFIREVVRQLNVRELTRLEHQRYEIYFPDFISRMARQHGGPIHFLLDEFDRLLEPTFVQARLLDALRAVSNQGDARFVVAGYRKLFQAFSDLNSPMYNFARPMRLAAFDRMDSHALILEPMDSLRIRVEPRTQVADRIHALAGGQPNLIQIICSVLLERLEQLPAHRRTITLDMLDGLSTDPQLQQFVLHTFLDNTRNLEKALVYGALLDLGAPPYTLDELDTMLARRGIQVLAEDLERSCRNLELSAVWVEQQGRYSFVTPILPTLLRHRYNLEYMFGKLLQEGIWL